MIGRIFMIIVFFGGAFYLYDKKNKPNPVEQLPAVEMPPEPPELKEAPPQVLSEAELIKIRQSTKDTESHVRWAAIELLHRLGDPQARQILRQTMHIDTDAGLRRNALGIVRTIDDPERVPDLLKSLKDTETGIRMAALTALGEVGDPLATAPVTKMLVDVDPAVRRQALLTLGRIDQIQKQRFAQRQEELRRQHEQAVRKAEEEIARRKRILEGKPDPAKVRDLLKEARQSIDGNTYR